MKRRKREGKVRSNGKLKALKEKKKLIEEIENGKDRKEKGELIKVSENEKKGRKEEVVIGEKGVKMRLMEWRREWMKKKKCTNVKMKSMKKYNGKVKK